MEENNFIQNEEELVVVSEELEEIETIETVSVPVEDLSWHLSEFCVNGNSFQAKYEYQ